MENPHYYGCYARFETSSKKDAGQLLGADNLVGDAFEIVFITEKSDRIAWMKNRFGALVGFFDKATSRKLSLYEAKGWVLCALLSFVAYSESPAPGLYWGEAALMCYDPRQKDAFLRFVTNTASRLSDGIRPAIDLGEGGISQLLESGGEWMPAKRIPFPAKEAGTAILKSRRAFSEKMIEQARAGNKGCYVAGWAFLLAIVAALLFGLKACGVF
ncbi:MAG: hypothetical protein LBG81_09035 [Coriobacteriaceae bacterium]|nr:hypothetical protein [Coriobacteriaceae bacterium]